MSFSKMHQSGTLPPPPRPRQRPFPNVPKKVLPRPAQNMEDEPSGVHHHRVVGTKRLHFYHIFTTKKLARNFGAGPTKFGAGLNKFGADPHIFGAGPPNLRRRCSREEPRVAFNCQSVAFFSLTATLAFDRKSLPFRELLCFWYEQKRRKKAQKYASYVREESVN